MGYIYKICNDINNKVYVGQTTRTIEERFSEHCHSALKGSNFLIHKAMREYGINNFFVVEIEKCNDELLDDKEKYYINKYDSYYNGYNSTPGGRGIIS